MAYYYLSSSLTPLEFGDHPEMSFLFLCEKYKENLSQSDMQQLDVIRKKMDLMNIKKILRNEEIDKRGILNKKELQDVLNEESYFDEYVFEFLHKHEGNAEKILNFPELLNQFFKVEAEKAKGFLKDLLELQRNWRLILTSYRTKKQKGDLSKQLAFEDPYDVTVSSLFAQRDSTHFEAPEGYEEFAEMLISTKEDPMQQYRSFAEFRFRAIKELVQDNFFSLDYLIAYAIQVIILEDFHGINKKEGEKVLNTIVKDTA